MFHLILLSLSFLCLGCPFISGELTYFLMVFQTTLSPLQSHNALCFFLPHAIFLNCNKVVNSVMSASSGKSWNPLRAEKCVWFVHQRLLSAQFSAQHMNRHYPAGDSCHAPINIFPIWLWRSSELDFCFLNAVCSCFRCTWNRCNNLLQNCSSYSFSSSVSISSPQSNPLQKKKKSAILTYDQTLTDNFFSKQKKMPIQREEWDHFMLCSHVCDPNPHSPAYSQI